MGAASATWRGGSTSTLSRHASWSTGSPARSTPWTTTTGARFSRRRGAGPRGQEGCSAGWGLRPRPSSVLFTMGGRNRWRHPGNRRWKWNEEVSSFFFLVSSFFPREGIGVACRLKGTPRDWTLKAYTGSGWEVMDARESVYFMGHRKARPGASCLPTPPASAPHAHMQAWLRSAHMLHVCVCAHAARVCVCDVCVGVHPVHDARVCACMHVCIRSRSSFPWPSRC
jgi:hypothetical protein